MRKLNISLRVVEGPGPTKPGNLDYKVLIPAAKQKDDYIIQ